MLHHWLHLWHGASAAVRGIGVAFFLPDAIRAMLKKQFLKAAGVYLLCALFWGFGFGIGLVSWLTFLGLTAFGAGLKVYMQRREKKKNQLV